MKKEMNYIRVLIMITALMFGAVSEMLAQSFSFTDNDIAVTGNGTAKLKTEGGIVTNDDGTHTVTLTIEPGEDSYIKASDIKVEKLVNPDKANAPKRRVSEIADVIVGKMYNSDMTKEITSVKAGSTAKFVFTVPADYDGAYVTATFHLETEGDIIRITASSDLGTTPSMTANYVLVEDVSATVVNALYSAGTFTGTFEGEVQDDGSFPKITGLEHALFQKVNGGKVKNIMFDNVNISGGTNAGAVCNEAIGDSRIYNCGVLATGSTANTDEDGYTYLTACSSTVSGSDYVGSIVGLLDGTSRVINCFSYANVSGGTVGGIVGYNNVATTATNLKTMVMNCMFYGEVSGTSIAPIYNGKIITNVGENGVGNYNYFRLESSYIENTENPKVYNCALGAETRFLQRFEFFRHLLNSHRELAAWWASTSITPSPNVTKDDMAKWVLEPSQIGSSTPYPVLKVLGYYPSVVNIDAKNATTQAERNKGGKLGTLAVNIRMGDGAKFEHPTGATITKPYLTLNITDKDFDHFNFNYYKVQLPYYNEVGTGNYTGNRVVTGWKIVSITGGTPGTFSTNTADAPSFNFADRNCTNKDLYGSGGSNRVFNQGAYWDVPEGVTAITIEPYWARCVYLADPNADKVYDKNMKTGYDVPNVGGGQIYTNGNSYSIAGEDQIVYTSMGNAIASSGSALFSGGDANSHTVNDYAVVLVGNYHHYGALEASNGKPYTVTSIDRDGDNEPDYSYILRFDSRTAAHPVKVDFINIPGLGMAQKSTGGTGSYNFGIMQPKGWFESTNTSLFRVTQFEYDRSDRGAAPYIVQGGVMEQWVSGQNNGAANNTTYFHVGGNAWFKEFHRGTHQDKNLQSKHPPVSVTGGDYDEFYLTGLYTANVTSYGDNAECYINGGRFGVVAGAAMEGLGGNITWQVQNADIKEFYAGGINAAKPVTGNLSTTITGGKIDLFCGGPKFGDMSTGKTVTTNATDCIFGTFFGAGYGGNSYSRQAPRNHNNLINFPHNDSQAGNDASWNAWLSRFYTQSYSSTYGGVSTQFSYQFLPMSGNEDNCARIFVEYVKFSLATCRNVTSTLTGCKITGNFYGGGSLGMVDGPVTSTLTNCEVQGSAFGAGFSASIPSVEVDYIGFETEPYYYKDLGTYRKGVKGSTTTYKWQHGSAISIDTDKKILYTTENLDGLGAVTGKATLTINGTTTVGKSVYGGGEESGVGGDTEVNVTGGTIGATGQGSSTVGNVFGGGNLGEVAGSTNVSMSGGAVHHSVYGGGCEADVKGNTNVTMEDGYVFNGIFGGGLSGSVGTVTARIAKNYDGTDHDTSHTGCVGGKPTTFAENTGKCTVVVTGGQIGPIEVASKGMTRPAAEGGPVPEGWVWGAGCGVVADPATDPDTDFRTYVKETDVTIGGTAFILESIIGGGEFGRVLGDTHVTIQDNCQIGVGYQQVDGGKPKRYANEKFVNPATTTITNDNALAPCSHYDYVKNNPLPYDPYYDDASDAARIGLASTSNPSDGKTWIGCVFGGGSGYMPYKKADDSGYGWIPSAGLVEGNTLVEIKGGHILTNVYGGNEVTDVKGKCTVKMSGGTIGVPRTLAQIQANPFNGNLYGAGKGDPRTYFNTYTNVGSVEVDVSGGIIYGSVYGGGEDGHVTGNVTTTIRKETGEGKVAPVIGCFGTSGDDGNVFGAGQGSTVSLTSGVVSGNATLNIQDGDIKGSVYGGGQIGSVGTHIVSITDTEKYGKMQDGEGHGYITVNLTGGTIEQNVYGGCMGTTADVDFGVSKNVTVELNNGVADNAKGCAVKGSIFGCNNINSSPEGTVSVHVYATQHEGKSQIANTPESGETPAVEDAKVKGSYDVTAVYGGGNMAAYMPKNLETGTTNVTIDGCGRTSIRQVYGGGNAASVPAATLTVNGTYEIEEVFGGGNGLDDVVKDGVTKPNPGANVGYKDYSVYYQDGDEWKVKDDPDYDTKEKRIDSNIQYGTGKASVNIFGGTIHRVFGGSNTKGNVRQTAVTMLEEAGGCDFCVDEAYGGGKSAPMDAEAKLLMACIPGLQAAYGGAEAADIQGNVTLNITNGNFNRVFGGNNLSGTISGSITVNIEEVGCKPIIIGELYGGGNQAGYSVKGYDSNKQPKETGDDIYDQPQVNVRSFTSIGNIYGGGYGAGAKMVGNPTVNINVAEGDKKDYTSANDASTYKNANNEDVPYYDTEGFKELTLTIDGHEVTLPNHKAGKIGAINNVFGGGNAAEVIGNTKVNIGTEVGNDVYMEVVVPKSATSVAGYYTRSGAGTTASPYIYTEALGEPADGTTYYEKKTVIGADIRGNVYGGGNNAEVTGNTNVNIGKKEGE